MRRDQRQHAAGCKLVDRLGEEIIVQRQLLAVVIELHVGEGDVADDGVELRQNGFLKVLDADLLVGKPGPGDAAGDGVQFHADELHAFRSVGHEIARAATRLKDEGVGRNARALSGRRASLR